MSLLPDIPGTHPGGNLGAYADLCKRRWLVFLLCLSAGFASGAALLWLIPPSYTATAEVLVVPTGVRDEVTPVTARFREPLNLDTQARIAQSAAVAHRAEAMLGSGPDTEPASIEVTVPPNSSILSISATAASPRLAAAQAQAYAEAYLAHRAQEARRDLDLQIRAVAARIRQVSAELNASLAALPGMAKGSAEYAMALRRQRVMTRQIHDLTLKHDALKTVTVGSGSVITNAVPPSAPSTPRLPLYLGSGVMLGLLAGAVGAVARDRLDTRLRSSRDVERLTGTTVLAELPVDRDGTIVDITRKRHEQTALRELAAALLASSTGDHLLLRPVGEPCDVHELAVTLRPVLDPVNLLTGDDLHDLVRAQSALLVIAPFTPASEVTSAIRSLIRHGTRVLGAVMLCPRRRPRSRRDASRPGRSRQATARPSARPYSTPDYSEPDYHDRGYPDPDYPAYHPDPVYPDPAPDLLVAPSPTARSRRFAPSPDTAPLHMLRPRDRTADGR
ncbi:YveK family protein [Thermostaphylospora chromogena]|uniref:Chain length determinant protein n=1 Tax=Thermostaphylospora chromogena TaxID=35622 RepID=A0A1H1BBB2_9ACTN|nr:hypothetical protein [Thermostaphylospora chromogena]SDQ48656.1 Chain length determinant protein [Thermostaphylospora chromogena]